MSFVTDNQTHTSEVTAARQRLLAALRRRQRLRMLALMLPLAAGLITCAGLAYRWPAWRWPGAALGLGLLALCGWRWYARRLRLPAALRQLDRHFPTLEDSSGLLVEDFSAAPDSSLLLQLQRQRVAGRLLSVSLAEAFPVGWGRPLAAAALLTVVGAALWLWPAAPPLPADAGVEVQFPASAKPDASRPAARLLSTVVRVQPPAYTRRPAFTAAQASFSCPAGSQVRWTVRSSAPTAPPALLLPGRRPVPFRRTSADSTTFQAEYRFTASTLYQIQFGGQLSEDYAVEVVPDQRPEVRLLTPAAYTLVAAHHRPLVPVRVQLHDDYGLTRARLVLTAAQGEGEAVKFRETVVELGNFGGQPRTAQAGHQLNLPRLGLTYGDELYVYAEAWDNAGHRTRTDAHLVQWQDTAAAGDLSDLALGVNPVPAYFRSQRQIIIDTEKLLAERKTLSVKEFQQRANSLGEDQKILRLRYGKFLGEEYEQGIGEAAPHPDGDDHNHAEPDHHDHAAPAPLAEGPPTAEALTAPYVHRHDDAETADFLEPQVKAKLRAVLSQMWDAELQLRLAHPAEARPFEYRALRLLKEVQQQTRAYVRKSGVELPPLPVAEKRLTGDVSQAAAPTRQAQRRLPEAQPAVRAALRKLAGYRAGQLPRPADAAALAPAGQHLSAAALARPGSGLAAVRAWRQLMQQVRAGQRPSAAGLSVLERALTRLLPPPPAAPAPLTADPLAQDYFRRLRASSD